MRHNGMSAFGPQRQNNAGRGNRCKRELYDPSGQYDDIARVSCTKSGASCGGRAAAAGHRYRKSARCADRVVPATRQAGARVLRISSTGITAPGTEFFLPETKPRIWPVRLPETGYQNSHLTNGPLTRALTRLFSQRLGHRRFRCTAWWAPEDSNLQPDRYERGSGSRKARKFRRIR